MCHCIPYISVGAILARMVIKIMRASSLVLSLPRCASSRVAGGNINAQPEARRAAEVRNGDGVIQPLRSVGITRIEPPAYADRAAGQWEKAYYYSVAATMAILDPGSGAANAMAVATT